MDELAGRLTIEEVTAEAIRLADEYRCAAYVYRLPNGNLRASVRDVTGAERIGRYE
jgi:hypothetical protein